MKVGDKKKDIKEDDIVVLGGGEGWENDGMKVE